MPSADTPIIANSERSLLFRFAMRLRCNGSACSTAPLPLGTTSRCSRSDVSSYTPPPPGRPQCAKHVANGLKKCQNKSFRFRFPNFIRIPLLLRIITHDTAASELAQAAYFPFLSTLRVLSETLALRRACSSDLLDNFPHQKEKALIGIRFSGGPLFPSPNSLGVRTWFLAASCGALASALWQVLGRLLCARSTPSGHSSGVGWPRALPCFPRPTGAISIVPCGLSCRRYRIPPLGDSVPTPSAGGRHRS